MKEMNGDIQKCFISKSIFSKHIFFLNGNTINKIMSARYFEIPYFFFLFNVVKACFLSGNNSELQKQPINHIISILLKTFAEETFLKKSCTYEKSPIYCNC